VLASAAAAQASVSFVNFGLPSIGPDLRRHFGLSLPGLGAVLTATLFGSGLALILAGIAVDRLGHRRATLGGTALAATGLAIAAAAGSSTATLIAGLLVSGIGSSVIPIAGTGALFRAFPADRRGWALGVRQMAVPLGGTIAAVAMPALVHVEGVWLAFAVASVALAVSCSVFALVAEDGARRRPRVERAFRSVLGAPGMLRLLVVASLYIVVLTAILSYIVPSARAAGLSSFWAGFTFFAVNITAMISRLVWGRVADRQGGSRRVRTLVETGVVGAIGGSLFALALHGGPALVVRAAVLFGFGALGWNALLYVAAGERTVPELAGRSVATAATVVFLISAIATPPLGALADRAGWDVFWITAAALSAVGALVARRLSTPAAPRMLH
jgi:MFS family permease